MSSYFIEDLSSLDSLLDNLITHSLPSSLPLRLKNTCLFVHVAFKSNRIEDKIGELHAADNKLL